jgi:glutaredoxin
LSDFWPHGAVAELYGVLTSAGHSERALFIIDKEGCIRYIDIHDIDKQPDNQVLYRELRRIDPVAAAHEPKEAQVTAAPLPHGGIVMYCTAWCPDCKRARKWLAENNLPYTEVNITTTPGADQQVRKWANGNVTTPTFDINGTILVDFNEDKLRDVLGMK